MLCFRPRDLFENHGMNKRLYANFLSVEDLRKLP